MNQRPSRLETLLQVAQVMSQRGTCSRLQVGAVIHRDGRILSTGYNGAPAGIAHCNHDCTCSLIWDDEDDRHDPTCNSRQPCTIAAHAERNAIDWAARVGVSLLGAELVTTDSPCAACAGSIINSGIKSVIAEKEYRDHQGIDWLYQARVSFRLASAVI